MSWGSFNEHQHTGEDSFWPSFTDIMMVIVMIFLLVTVAVVLTNTRLLDELRNSVQAEEAAAELAEFRLKENATLEEQLEYFQQRTSNLEMEVLRSRANSEQLQNRLSQSERLVQQLNQASQQQSTVLSQREQRLGLLQSQLSEQQQQVSRLEQSQNEQQITIERLQTQLSEKEQTVTELQASRDQAQSQLDELQGNEQSATAKLSQLQGEYDELDKKYQKLIRPARSKKNKTVVDVMYNRNGYRIRKAGESGYHAVSRSALEQELAGLKQSLGDQLYVKIIIPERSGLSYNEAWRFTQEMLNRYDYYYQADSSKKTPTSNEEAANDAE